MPKRSDYRPMVYICSAFSGDELANTQKTKRYCRYALDHGFMPVAPHLMYPQFMDETTERDLAIHMALVLLGKCEEVWVIGNSLSQKAWRLNSNKPSGGASTSAILTRN